MKRRPLIGDLIKQFHPSDLSKFTYFVILTDAIYAPNPGDPEEKWKCDIYAQDGSFHHLLGFCKEVDFSMEDYDRWEIIA